MFTPTPAKAYHEFQELNLLALICQQEEQRKVREAQKQDFDHAFEAGWQDERWKSHNPPGAPQQTQSTVPTVRACSCGCGKPEVVVDPRTIPAWAWKSKETLQNWLDTHYPR